MKRFIIFFVVLCVGATAGAQGFSWYTEGAQYSYTKYDLFYSISGNQMLSTGANWHVSVRSDRKMVNIFGTNHSLRPLGTITSNGETFDSFCYGTGDRMFCVSRYVITITGTTYGTLKGYIVMIDGSSYLARKL